MTTINAVVQAMVSWLKTQQFTPQLREVVCAGAMPPAAYPHAAIEVLEEQQVQRPGGFRAVLSITVAQAHGRPAAAQATARDIAHQLRRALNQSHGLGGVVKGLTVAGIRHSSELKSDGDFPILAKSTLTVIVSYDETLL